MPKRRKVKITPDDAAQDAAAQAPSSPAERPDPEAAPAAAEMKAVVEPAEERIRGLEQQLADAEARAEQLNDKYLRAVADLENYRRRARRERANAVRDGEAAILLEVLPVLDNFARAMEAAQGANEVQSLMDGVKMIHQQLHEALARKGVRPIAAEGKPFDPTYHDAVGKLESGEHEEGTVAVEIQKGYMFGDRVLRPSRVMVAVKPAGETDVEDTEREES